MFLKIFMVLVLAIYSVNASATNINIFTGDSSARAVSAMSCNNVACNQLCERLGFTGGICVGDRCKCDNFKGLKDQKTSDSVIKSCDNQACDRLCRSLGFPGGACLGDKCDCDNFKSSRDDKPVVALPGACDVVACNDMCHRLNYIGGMCRDDTCQCF